jgi:hypothetical protein
MLSRSNSPRVISTLCVMFMAIDVCFLHESKYLYGSTKAGYLGETRSRRARRCSLDAYVECARCSRAGWWHSNASCCKWAVDDLTKQRSAHTMESVSSAHVHSLPGCVVPVDSQALDSYATRHCSFGPARSSGVQDGRE